MALTDLLNGTGATLGAISSAAIGAAYQRFLRLERVTSKVEQLFNELRDFPQNVSPRGGEGALLGDLKRFIESSARSISAPRVQSRTALGDSKTLADALQKIQELERRVSALAQQYGRIDAIERRVTDHDSIAKRVSEVEDTVDDMKEQEAAAWSGIKEDLAWLRGKLGLPSPRNSGAD